ncbi:MAG TPA: hypothetical protein VMM84_00085, partial [Pyrinomonadaceae bacterium]|nr:hypothetical protein [Pyrinomonadaceae bacterium]
MYRLFALLLAIIALLPTVVSSAGSIQRDPEIAKQQTDQALRLGSVTERTISAGQAHTFTIEAKGDQYLHVVVYQRGIDLMVALLGPDGTKIMEEDRTDAFGPEMLGGILPPAGQYKIELQPV